MSINNLSENELMLNRLIEALTQSGLKKHGMGKQIREKTGYSSGQVSNLLNGKDPLNDRFLKSVCREFFVSEDWVRYGSGEKISPPQEGYTNDGIKFRVAKFIGTSKEKASSPLAAAILALVEAMTPEQQAAELKRLTDQFTASQTTEKP